MILLRTRRESEKTHVRGVGIFGDKLYYLRLQTGWAGLGFLAFLAAIGIQTIIDLKETKKELFDKIAKTNLIVLFALVFIFLPIFVSLLLSQAGKPLFVYFLFPIINGFSLFLIYFLIYSFLIFCLIKLKDKGLVLFLILICLNPP